MTVQIEELTTFDDPRGSTFEPVDETTLASSRNVHVVVSGPGHVRGNHAHLRGTEALIVRGPARVVLEDDGVRSEHAVERGRVVRFLLPAGVAHAVQNTGVEPMVLVSFGTEPHAPHNTVPRRLL